MKYKLLTATLLVIFFFFTFSMEAIPQGKKEGKINWVEGYISAIGTATATPSGNKVKDELRAIKGATILGQRLLLETVKGVKIDSQTKVENMMVQEDVVNARIEGTIEGAEIVKQNVRWEGDTPIASVEVRICLGGFGVCESESSLVNVLALDQKNEQANVPSRRLSDIAVKQEPTVQKVQDVIYDSSKPVTGIIFNLQGLFFERVILPVVITVGDQNTPFTVYSVKSVEPQVIRTYGVVRYADSVDQASQNPHLGNNIIIVPVSGIIKENIIMIGFDAARIIRETTSYGNDYLKSAKVIITSK